LLSLAEKRRKLNESRDAEAASGPIPSCARTDAKMQNREIQMKYDIAKNEDGPLRKTMKATASEGVDGQHKFIRSLKDGEDPSIVASEHHPGLDDRMRNIETHLAVRYVPSAPRSLLDRLRFLEDHVIHLEKEYPPWAALHFNQPNRGWPPPPRTTPIIVPSHLTSSAPSMENIATKTTSQAPIPSASLVADSDVAHGKGKSTSRKHQSSLHRAVMERLEVQNAMSDLAGAKNEPA